MSKPQEKDYSREDFERDLCEVQVPMYGYIISLLGAGPESKDVLQDTNLFLCERWRDFEPGTSFKSWAFRVAYFNVLGCRRDRVRRDEVEFSEQTLLHINDGAENFSDAGDERLHALRQCLGRLTPEDRKVLAIRYTKGNSLTQYARRTGKTVATVHKTISRIRFALRTCVDRRLRSQ